MSQMKQFLLDLVYIPTVGPRVDGKTSREVIAKEQEKQKDVLHQFWSPRLVISAGGLDRYLGLQIAEKEEGRLVARGRHFISNMNASHYFICIEPRLIAFARPCTEAEGGCPSHERRSCHILHAEELGSEGYTEHPCAEDKTA